MSISRTSPVMRERNTAAETTPAERKKWDLPGSAAEEFFTLFDAPDLHLAIDFFGLLQAGEIHSRQAGRCGSRGNTPAERLGRPVRVALHRPGERGAQCVAGADRTHGVHARRSRFVHSRSERSYGA